VLAFAVSQCARFVHCPRRTHEEALLRIGLCLKGARDRGLVITPSADLKMEMHCDADFAGLWGHEEPIDPSCVKSRSGHLILVSDCPIVWGSKLQSEIAASACMSECCALSCGMRQLLPVLDLMSELADAVGLGGDRVRQLCTTVHEDNDACWIIASKELPMVAPRTKHFAAELHWFGAKASEHRIQIIRCASADNIADVFSEAVRCTTFELLRKKLMGW